MNLEAAFMRREFPQAPDLDWYDAYKLPLGWQLVEHRLAGRFILDVGCGNGWLAYHARKAGARVIASDIFETWVHPTLRPCFVLCSKMTLPFAANTFDAVLTSNTLHHGTLVESCQEAYRVLKPGGFFISFTEPCIWNVRDEASYMAVQCAVELASGIAERRPNLIAYHQALRGFQTVSYWEYQTMAPVTGDDFEGGLVIEGVK